MTPDGGITWLLPRLIGLRRAQEMVLLNRRVPAEEAERIGLITRVIDDAELARDGIELAERMAAASTSAAAVARRLLWQGATSSLVDQLADEAASIGRSAGTPDGREGVTAFLARRSPDFRR